MPELTWDRSRSAAVSELLASPLGVGVKTKPWQPLQRSSGAYSTGTLQATSVACATVHRLVSGRLSGDHRARLRSLSLSLCPEAYIVAPGVGVKTKP